MSGRGLQKSSNFAIVSFLIAYILSELAIRIMIVSDKKFKSDHIWFGFFQFAFENVIFCYNK